MTIFMHQTFHWVLIYVFCQIIMNVSKFSLKTQMNESENALSENMLSQFLRSYDNNTVQRQGSLGGVCYGLLA